MKGILILNLRLVFCVKNMLMMVALVFSTALVAQAENLESNTPFVEEAVVTGKHPGPAMWKIEKDGHVLWIYGVMNQFPHSTEWDSSRAERVVSESQSLIEPPRTRVVNNAGFFRSGKLYKEYAQIQRLPKGQALSDVLPPELLASYQDVKERYAPNNSDIDQLRPFFAAERLFVEAVRTLDLSGGVRIPEKLEKVARRHDIPVILFNFEIPLESEIDGLKRASMESEIACMQTILDYINTDLKLRPNRVNAWAVGNRDELERLGYTTELPHNCKNRTVHAEAVQKVRAQWLDAVAQALEENLTTFVLLPIPEILSPNGLMAELLSRGYSLADQENSDH